jgi:hypothetical protein
MGGASSKLDENNWSLADGKLRGVQDTVDGQPPVQQYEVYYMTKRAVNQREFNILDERDNLVFTTRAVRGTIACFDLLGSGRDDYILRVNVDIARRFWIISRFYVPSFEGQMPDKEATEKLAAQLDEDSQHDIGTGRKRLPILYKRCCITVSWSRYMMVAAHYGPPSIAMVLSASQTDTEIDQDEQWMRDAAKISSRMKERQRIISNGKVEDLALTSSESDPPLPEPENSHFKRIPPPFIDKDETDKEVNAEKKLSCETSPSLPDIPPADQEVPHQFDKTNKPNSTTLLRSATISAETSMLSMQDWFRQQSQSIQAKSKAAFEAYAITKPKEVTNADLLEGVVQFERPLLRCQEIYNRFFGNHQTSLVSKEQVLDLLEQDREQHAKDHPEDNVSYLENDPLTRAERDILKENGGAFSSAAERLDANNDIGIFGAKYEQPLVGYWSWEHTLRTHQIKVHVAKGTDLALHVIMAVIASQVRFERHAIAMTI